MGQSVMAPTTVKQEVADENETPTEKSQVNNKKKFDVTQHFLL